MIVTDIIPYGKLKSKVLTDEDFAFSVYRKEIGKLKLEKGSEISKEQFQDAILPLLTRRAKQRVLVLLKNRDYTEVELLKKLKEGCCPETLATEAVQWAKGLGYVDDIRYAEQFMAYHTSGKSKKRIHYELMKKGISKEEVEHLMEENPPDERGQILRELEKSRFSEKDAKERNRILSRLMRRGYPWSEIDSALRELGEDILE